MKLKPGAWFLIGFGGLILLAFFIVALAPAPMPSPDAGFLRSSPMPVITGSRLPVLADAMPPFSGITRWWNTDGDRPLTAEDLRGKVVWIDFWTYSCINCIRTQPFLRKMWETYQDDGLVIVGVHTPEFAFEKDPDNVERAIGRAGLEYPIALDPNYETWNAYGNRYWPAGYFFDREGRLRFAHFGEGEYEEQERVIRELLEEGAALAEAPVGGIPMPAFALTRTPETYFGSARMASFANRDEFQAETDARYTLRDVGANEWSVDGRWNIRPEYAESLHAGNRFRMNVESNAMHLVLGSSNGTKRVRVTVDGVFTDEIEVTVKQLYTVARFPEGGRHLVEVELADPGVEFYAVTFGE
ncbi:hypothetical protein EDM68_03510 [Candidatus Uhrbacteria bacterium]|nr:MAG: hypothetical protein EDM68_03510 [Candidatus Uhrbacteria bacterium]